MFDSARSFLHLITGLIFIEKGLVRSENVLVNKSSSHFSCSENCMLMDRKALATNWPITHTITIAINASKIKYVKVNTGRNDLVWRTKMGSSGGRASYPKEVDLR